MIPELILYLLKVNLALLLFFGGYQLFLKHFTFYSLNRIYLLLGLIYSSLFPMIKLGDILKSNTILKEQIISITPDWRGSVSYVISQSPDSGNIYWQAGIFIFWTGVIFMSIRLIIQMFSLLILHLQSEPSGSGDYRFRVISKKLNPFSFWKTIYINPQYHQPEELQSILKHEQVHVKQLHSLDVLIAELSIIFYWFNPGVWLMKKAIQANLEFITDQQVLNSGIDSRKYQYALLKISVLPQNALPVNNFHLLSIKKRIAMMNKRPSNGIKKSIYLLLLPAIMCMVLVVTNSKAALNNNPLSGVIKNLPGMPQIIGINSYLSDEGIKSSEKLNTPNKKSGIIPPESTIQADTTKIKKIDKALLSGKFSVKGDSLRAGAKKPMYILDGVEIKDPGRINPDNIATINVSKGALNTARYGSGASAGVIEIVTKSALTSAIGNAKPVIASGFGQNQSEKVTLGGLNNNELILLDGKEVDRSVLNDLSVMSVGKIEVFKGEKALSKFGEKGRNGVVVITTKKN